MSAWCYEQILDFVHKSPDLHNRTPDPWYPFLSAGSGPNTRASHKQCRQDHPPRKYAPCFLRLLA